MTDLEYFGFTPEPEAEDGSQVFSDFLVVIADKQMRDYKNIIQYGGKAGQSYYSHVMDVVAMAEKLRPAVGLDATQMRVVVLALVVHDINKLAQPNEKGWIARYSNAASFSTIEAELVRLEVGNFFPQWSEYLNDIIWLAHNHQVKTGSEWTLDPRLLEKCKLKSSLLRDVLKHLVRDCDIADLSHSGDYLDPHEKHIRIKLLHEINAAMSGRQYRFFGHRLAELRGLFSNTIHNALVEYFRQKYGSEACLDLQYYPEGVNYLLDRKLTFEWNEQSLNEVAALVATKLAQAQEKQLQQFIKARPAGIVVDDAAIASGATLDNILETITRIAAAKQYKAEWREQRNIFAHNDLEEALNNPENRSRSKIAGGSFVA